MNNLFTEIKIRQPLFIVRMVVELIDRKETRYSICLGAANELYFSGDHIKYQTFDKIFNNLDKVREIIANNKESKLQGKLDDDAFLTDDALAHAFKDSRSARGLQDLEASRHDVDAPQRLKDVMNAESLLHQKDWNIYYLTSIGYSIEESLQLMVDYYSLLPTRQQARHGGNDNPRLAMFRDYPKYIAMHYEVYWTSLSPNNNQAFRSTNVDPMPESYKKLAKRLLLKGITTQDYSFTIAAQNIVNFAYWNGSKHRQAFESFMSHWLPNAKSLTRFMKTIRDINSEEMKEAVGKSKHAAAVKAIKEHGYEGSY